MKRIFKHPLILSLLIIFCLIFINQQGWLNSVYNIFFKSSSFVQENIFKISLKTNNFIDFVVSIKNLEQENIELKKNNLNLLGEFVKLKEIEKENEMLREQIGLPLSESSELILASIIGKDSSDFGKYFLINKGKKDGIKEKSVVIVSGNLLVGQAIEVFDSFSRIQLIIDPNSLVNARIQDSKIMGLIKGGQELDLVFDLLPQGKNIEVDSLVVTSGLSGLFPAGLLIGQIEKVISSEAQISQIAKVKPVVDFYKLDKVFVIIK